MAPDDAHRRSTSEVKALPFTAHGKVDIWAEGDLHLYEATGPFNKELVDGLALAQASFLQHLQPVTPWVSICIVKSSALSTPEGVQRYGELIRQAPERFTPAATAFVTSAMLRTCEVRLPAMELTESVRSFHVPDTPSTLAWPRPSRHWTRPGAGPGPGWMAIRLNANAAP